MSKKILECSRAGDSRFSAMIAKVAVNGVDNIIENHYQKSKVFLSEDGKFYTVNSAKEVGLCAHIEVVIICVPLLNIKSIDIIISISILFFVFYK